MTETDAHLAASLSRRFRLIRKLGAGGMGAVFLAEQIAVGNRPVALKVLSRKLLDDPEFLLRFQNEAASTGRIHHLNVVTIYESGQADDGTPYIAMEFLEGESLRQTLARRGALPVHEVAEILQQAARGLNAAHKLGIIHRDLKPDNIFLTYPDDDSVARVSPPANAQDVGAGLVPALSVGIADTGRAQEPALNGVKEPPLRPVVVKLVDFGIAKLRESGMHTQTGMVLGTPPYMSFEQASGMRSDELDARSDIYSLGVVVYEMLTGRTPFHSDTPVGYLRMHMQEDPPPFRVVKPDLPALPQLESVVMKALTKDRSQRYSSVLEFGEEVTRVTLSEPSSHSPRRTITTKLTEADISGRATPEKTNRMKRLSLTVLMILIAVGGVWYFSQMRRNGNPPRLSPPTGMVYIPGGTFAMGRDDAEDAEETPAHSVTLTPFYFDKFPVTNVQFDEFVTATHYTGREEAIGSNPPRTLPGDFFERPVTNVSWEDAQAFCKWKGQRLPTEAEWEYAARGTDGRLYPWGNDLSVGLVNSLEAGVGHPEVVGSHPGNSSPFGVLDMSGNIWQWCDDDFRLYPGSRQLLPPTPTGFPPFSSPLSVKHFAQQIKEAYPEYRKYSDDKLVRAVLEKYPQYQDKVIGVKVTRGGSYTSGRDHLADTTRHIEFGSTRSPDTGFRCAKSM